MLGGSVSPARSGHGAEGIPVREGRTLPFTVTRSWSAPEGYYLERWYLIDPETREVLYEGPEHMRLIWGLQGLTEITDQITDPVALKPGSYQIVFSLGGQMGGELDVVAAEVGTEAA
jgi:hypothetical protein